MINNPILPGFNPDPSILRVGDTYYIATSTFEWFPGVKLYQSNNLSDWQQIGYALDRSSQLDLSSLDTARGVWAPCLSYNDDKSLFYLVYSNVYSMRSGYFDLDNFVVTAPNIEGPWSEASYLNSSGFDPSLFHDDDGLAWLVSLEWENRSNYDHPGWVVVQQYCLETNSLVGNVTRLTTGGTKRGCIEAPHLYKRGDYYYLMTAEGGTGYGHAVVMLRSTNVTGPYEPDPQSIVLSNCLDEFDEFAIDDSVKLHRFEPHSKLAKSGHGSLVHTASGQPYIAHLCARPFAEQANCILGRETALQACQWTDNGWLRLKDGGKQAQLTCEPPLQHPETIGQLPYSFGRDNFDPNKLADDYQSYRLPLRNDCIRLTNPGIEIKGTGSLFSSRHMSLLARRISHFNCRFETSLSVEPKHHLCSAGLTCFYSQSNFYYLKVYWSESLGQRAISILSSTLAGKTEYTQYRIAIDATCKVQLAFELQGKHLHASYCLANGVWHNIGPCLDASILSDEYGSQKFTGSFVGLFCEDLRQQQLLAQFDYLDYQITAKHKNQKP
ncbi:glycoside hydrolase family 43 protein [Alginatibacterium sediminis]|uniref:Glycoside hydrolase family 43 protein n=1 Tax=Alginatibacterium sediminis TaxID=2164068 RepID=A0A420EGW3_9ALTE|nr:glycoside hydrolase family 43 protein [Alginatibacterium sediminis]RKF19796.1 glycoside hydrolase family 43 protein [Alginatibacterium sediminis]